MVSYPSSPPPFFVLNECPPTYTLIRMLIYFASSVCCVHFFKWSKETSGRACGSDVESEWRGEGDSWAATFLIPSSSQSISKCGLHVGARGMGKSLLCPFSVPFLTPGGVTDVF